MDLRLNYKPFSAGIVWVIFALFGWQGVDAQKYDPSIEKRNLTIGPYTVEAHATYFDFDEKIVRKGFWKYTKSFGRLNNLKEYYEVIIPASETGGDVDIILLAQVRMEGERASLMLGPEIGHLPEKVQTNYVNQSHKILRNFKKEFYLDHYRNKITDLEKASIRVSRRYQRLQKKEGQDIERDLLLGELKQLEDQITQLREIQFQISGN